MEYTDFKEKALKQPLKCFKGMRNYKVLNESFSLFLENSDKYTIHYMLLFDTILDTPYTMEEHISSILKADEMYFVKILNKIKELNEDKVPSIEDYWVDKFDEKDKQWKHSEFRSLESVFISQEKRYILDSLNAAEIGEDMFADLESIINSY